METSGVFSVKVITFLTALALQFGNGFFGDPCPNTEDLLPCTCAQVSGQPENPPWNREIENILTVEESTPASASTQSSLDTPNDETPSHSHNNPSNSVPSAYTGPTMTAVTCKDVESPLKLEDAVTKALNHKWIDKLVVINTPPAREHQLAQIPGKWVQKFRLSQLEIRDSKLKGNSLTGNRQEGNPFEGQEKTLLKLVVSGCHLSGKLTYETFATTTTKGLNLLKRLEVLDLSHNLLIHIENNAFGNPPENLSHLNISYNSIETTEGHIFHNLRKLKYLDISHNILKEVRRDMFPKPGKELLHLDLSWNYVSSLPENFFHEMNSLKSVNLNRNFLFAISEKTWTKVWRQLSLIQLRDNFIECDCQILWLINLLPQSHHSDPASYAQRILGSCGHKELGRYKVAQNLTKLTRGSINCH